MSGSDAAGTGHGEHERALFALAVMNTLAAWLIGLGYVMAGASRSGLPVKAFVFAALYGQLGLFVFGICALLLGASRAGVRRPLYVLVPLLLTALLAVLFVDRGIYQLYRFHINGLVLQVLLTKGGWGTTDIPASDLLVLFSGIAAVLAAQAAGYHRLVRRASRRPVPRWTARRRWGVAGALIVALGVADRVTYAWADLAGAREVVRAAKLVPLYVPMTARGLARRLGMRRLGHTALAARAESRTLEYPRKEVAFREPEKRWNVLWIALDSWRRDAFSPVNTPKIWAFAQDAQVFENHLSGGNRTATGVFSMFYGIYGTYWDQVLVERKGPVLVSRLKALDYRMMGISSMPVAFLDLRASVFVDAQEAVTDKWEEERSADRDRRLIDEVDRFIGESVAAGKPFFVWALYDSSHVGYDFPPEHAVFTPYSGEVAYRELGVSEKRKIEAHNRYRNAVHYEDHLTGILLRRLEDRGLLDETIVIVTSDHGEEFYENGFWAHGGGCTPEEVRVPFVLRVPGVPPARHQALSGHQDVAATLLARLGVESPPEDYSLGRDLLAQIGPEKPEKPSPYLIACGWKQAALVDDDGWLVFGTDTDNPWDFEAFDARYRAVPDAAAAVDGRSGEIARALRGMTAFSP